MAPLGTRLCSLPLVPNNTHAALPQLPQPPGLSPSGHVMVGDQAYGVLLCSAHGGRPISLLRCRAVRPGITAICG